MTADDPQPRERKGKGQVASEREAEPAAAEKRRREALCAVVGEQVLHALGEPGDLWNLQVRPLWAGNYRVNVFVGADAACPRIAHSYFVIADDDGKIVTTMPAIDRSY